LGGTVNATGDYCGAGIGGGGYQGDSGNITISGGFVTASASASQGDPAAIGDGGFGNAGTIAITGGVVVAIAGSGGAIGGGGVGQDDSISISGGTVIAGGRGIGFGNSYGSTPITITGAPVIFATAINGWPSNPANGIASGGDVTINQPTITLNSDFTVPQNALLTISAGWTLNHTDYSLTINGTIINHGTLQTARVRRRFIPYHST
jgi:hypothetical protein